MKLLHGGLVVLLMLPAVVRGMSWVWMSEEMWLKSADLIAIVDVQEVHEVTTPEGIRLWSAEARVAKMGLLRYSDAVGGAPAMVIIYSLDVNADKEGFERTNEGSLPISKGRALVCLRQKGMNKFYPYEKLSFQPLADDGTVAWSTKKEYPKGEEPYQRMSAEEVIRRVREAAKKRPPGDRVE